MACRRSTTRADQHRPIHRDRGFDTFIRFSQVDPAVAWYKLEAMVQGAELATAELS
jgi:hypothetical protein